MHAVPLVPTSETLDECGSLSTCGTEDFDNYCISENKIYRVGDSCKSGTPLEPGVHVFEKGVGDNANKIFKIEISSSVTTPENLMVYNCDGNKCDPTDGYITAVTGIYSVLTLTNFPSSSATDLKIDGSDASVCNSGTIGKYYEIEDDGYYLCIGEERSVKISENEYEYIMLGTGAGGTPFATKSNIVIKPGENYAVLDNRYNTGNEDGIYCVYESNAIIERNENACFGTILNKLYTCNQDGECEEGTADVDPNPNYLVNNKLYVFTVDASSNKLTIAKKDSDNTGIFAYENNGSTNDLSYGTRVTDFTKDELESNTFLYYCDEGECYKTVGYIMYGDPKKKLAYCDGENACEEIGLNEHRTCNENGGAGNVDYKDTQESFEICVESYERRIIIDSKIYFANNNGKYEEYIATENIIGKKAILDFGYYLTFDNALRTVEEARNNEKYGDKLIKCSNDGCTKVVSPYGMYVNADGKGLIKCDPENLNPDCVLFDNVQNGYYVDADNELVICIDSKCRVEKAVAKSYYSGATKKLIYCNGEFECVEETIEIGVYKAADPTNYIIKCEYSSIDMSNICTTVEIADLANNLCSSNNNNNIGQLTSGGNLCLDGNSNTVNFESSGTNYAVLYGERSIFSSLVTTTESFGILSVTSEKIVLDSTNFNGGSSDKCKDKSILEIVDKQNGKCPDNSDNVGGCTNGVCNGKEGCTVSTGVGCDDQYYNLVERKVYYCDIANNPEGEKCQDAETIGYLVNYEREGVVKGKVKNAFKCPSTTTCDEYKFTITECNAYNIGLLYKTEGGNEGGEKVHLCLNYISIDNVSAKTAELIEKSGDYVLSYHVNNNVFTLASDEYALVAVSKNIVKLNDNYKNNLRFAYTNADYKLNIRGDTTSTFDSSKLIEFNCPKGNDEKRTGICTKN